MSKRITAAAFTIAFLLVFVMPVSANQINLTYDYSNTVTGTLPNPPVARSNFTYNFSTISGGSGYKYINEIKIPMLVKTYTSNWAADTWDPECDALEEPASVHYTGGSVDNWASNTSTAFYNVSAEFYVNGIYYGSGTYGWTKTGTPNSKPYYEIKISSVNTSYADTLSGIKQVNISYTPSGSVWAGWTWTLSYPSTYGGTYCDSGYAQTIYTYLDTAKTQAVFNTTASNTYGTFSGTAYDSTAYHSYFNVSNSTGSGSSSPPSIISNSTAEIFTICYDTPGISTNWSINGTSYYSGVTNASGCDSYTLQDNFGNFTDFNISVYAYNAGGNSNLTTWLKDFSISYSTGLGAIIKEIIHVIWWQS